MVQFAESTLRLAEIARRSGRAADAVDELWRMATRLEARAVDGHLDRETLVLLGRTRLALGVSLGSVLPEEHLGAATRWTGAALRTADGLDDQAFRAQALRMHGNELRKAGRVRAAVARLEQSLALSEGVVERGSTLALLARATGGAGMSEVFDRVIHEYRGLLDRNPGDEGVLFNRFVFREVRLRGLVGSGRIAEAAQLVHDGPSAAPPPAPQWTVIEQVTVGRASCAVDDLTGARDNLGRALVAAEAFRLPHQIQRIERVAREAALHDLADEADAVLRSVCASLPPACVSDAAAGARTGATAGDGAGPLIRSR